MSRKCNHKDSLQDAILTFLGKYLWKDGCECSTLRQNVDHYYCPFGDEVLEALGT